MHEEKLQELGLTQGEAKVYESLLLLGSSTVGPIVKKANVAYSNIYEILNRLIKKGLVSFIIKEKTKYFQAVEPIRIKEFLDKKELDLEKSKNTFNNLLPELEKLNKLIKNKEETEMFFGEKGLITAYEYLLKDTTKTDIGIFFYVYDERYYEKSEKFYIKSWHLVKKYNNKWKGLSNESLKQTRLVKSYPKFIEQRYVKFPVPGNIDTIKDKTLITVWSETPIGILIESKEVADNFRNYFYSIWNN